MATPYPRRHQADVEGAGLLADIRDEVFAKYPKVDPFASQTALRRFVKLVMDLHEVQYGVALCASCHQAAHKP